MGAKSRHKLLDVWLAEKGIGVDYSDSAEIGRRGIRIDFSSLARELLSGFRRHSRFHAS